MRSCEISHFALAPGLPSRTRMRGFALAVVLLTAACGEAQFTELTPNDSEELPLDCAFRSGVLPVLRAEPLGCSNGTCHNLHGVPASGLPLGAGPDALTEAEIDGIHALVTGGGGALQQADYGLDVSLAAPAESLLLTFPLEPAKGGDPNRHLFHKPLKSQDAREYRTLHCWIASGALND